MASRTEFTNLDAAQQEQASARFFNAGEGDGYLYELGNDGVVLCRQRPVATQGRPGRCGPAGESSINLRTKETKGEQMLQWMWFGVFAICSTGMALWVTYQLSRADLKCGEIALYLSLTGCAVTLLVDLVGMYALQEISSLLPEVGTGVNVVTTLVIAVSCVAGAIMSQLIILPRLLRLDESENVRTPYAD